MRSKSIRLHQRLASVLILLPLLLVGCEQWGQSGQLGTAQGKSESPLATSSEPSSSEPSVNEEFVRSAETAMGELNNGIDEREVASSDVNPDIQAALDEQLDEQIEVLQEQQQTASQTKLLALVPPLLVVVTALIVLVRDR
jgi:hypothetical protein